ncbi:MAG: formamidopyrimidine-DNA glycosylase [Pseudomonadales bacterium]|nr:formamidopyrimidine-DNA glycosylase [Pseudomonadales bacterium]MCP5183077.1 formamidopyrimidine-DNA glycosylase [Pseudomonadales bacterium]
MPELPDLTVYVEHLNRCTQGETLDAINLVSSFVLRTVAPTTEDLLGRRVLGWTRLAKQLVCNLEDERFLVIHLMISGRLQWLAPGKVPPKRNLLAWFAFATGSLLFTEASKKKRASLRLVQGRKALHALDPGGLEPASLSTADFAERLRASNHTLKRALTDQRVLAGIGNAYSDEILWRARLSPYKRPRDMLDQELHALFRACRTVLDEWTTRLREEAGDRFPARVTAFHDGMAVHGRYRQPCPACGAPVQHIVYAENESNYCATCQTGGRLLADRSLSRLLKNDWPKRVDELESPAR